MVATYFMVKGIHSVSNIMNILVNRPNSIRFPGDGTEGIIDFCRNHFNYNVKEVMRCPGWSIACWIQERNYPVLYYYNGMDKEEITLRFACDYLVKDQHVYEKMSCALEMGLM